MKTIERDNLILQHLHLAEKLACIQVKSIAKKISIDELKSAAYFGLVLAAQNYQGDFGASFITYATIRIRGSMRDYVRELKWGTRKKQVKAVQLAEYTKRDSNISWIVEDLKPLEKKIVLMYYEGGYTLKEIGAEIGVKESWVSQMLSKVRDTLKMQNAA